MKSQQKLIVAAIAAVMAASPMTAGAQTRQIQGAEVRAAQAADRAARPIRDVAGRTDRITDRAPVRDVRRQVDRVRPIERPERRDPPSNLRQRLRNACFGSDNPPQVCRRVYGQ